LAILSLGKYARYSFDGSEMGQDLEVMHVVACQEYKPWLTSP